MRFVLPVLVLLLLLLNSCTKCSNDKKTNAPDKIDDMKIEKVSSENSQEKQSQTETTTKTGAVHSDKSYSDTRIDLYVPGKIIAPDKLKKYLPATIAGTQSAKPSTGIIYGETGDVSTVSITYDFGKGGLVMRITDYGTKENIPPYDLKYFDVLPTKPGYETETLMDDMGKGYLMWSSEYNSGEMYYFLANRFIIKLEGYTMPPGTGGLVYFFDKIKRKKLIENIK
jgi:hypothetical protein